MINLVFEEEKVLSTQDIYEIINFSLQAAEENGFLNSFIFERALYLFAAICLYQDRKDELTPLIAANINTAWDTLIKDGTIEEMLENYQKDLDNLAEQGKLYFDEYNAYSLSARGLLNNIQEFTGDIVYQAKEALQKSSQETGVSQLLEIADNWGMNSDILKEENNQVLPTETLIVS